MIHIVPERNVVTEDFLAHAVGETRTLVHDRSSRKVVKKKTYEIEDGGRLKDCRAVAGRELTRLTRVGCLAAGAFRKAVGIEIANVRRIRLCPTRGIRFEDRDREIRARLLVMREKTC